MADALQLWTSVGLRIEGVTDLWTALDGLIRRFNGKDFKECLIKSGAVDLLEARLGSRNRRERILAGWAKPCA